MRSKTTFNQAIHYRSGWRQRMIFSVTMLIVMLLLPVASMAWTGTITFGSGTYSLTGGTNFTNSSGQTVTPINGYENLAVWGDLGTTYNCWYVLNGSLYNGRGAGRTLSILNLQPGQVVTITYDASSNDQNNYYITFRTSGQGYNKNAGDVVYSGQSFTMAGNGTLDLDVPRYHQISSIKVEAAPYPNYVHIDATDALGYKKWDASQKKMVDTNSSDPDGLPYFRTRLSARWFVEPGVSVEYYGTVQRWTIENYGPDAPANYNPKTGKGNKKVAVRLADDNMSNCDVMFINTGWCKVTAYCNGFNDSYLVECWDNAADYDIQDNGSKYIFVQNDSLANLHLDNEQGGIVQNRVITAIPGIEMKIGIPEMDEGDSPGDNNSNSDNHHQPNTAVVERYEINGTDHYVSWVNDDWGWWDRYPHNDSSWPQLGTFYTFKATADGKLTFGGVKVVKNNNENGNVYLVNLDNLTRIEVIGDNVGTGYYESQEIELTAGQRYALHGQAYASQGWWESSHWAPFLLEWFKFETDFALTSNYGITQNGDDSTTGNYETQVMISGTGTSGWSAIIVDATKDYKGNISSVGSVSISGGKLVLNNVTFSKTGKNEKGGAVKVRLQKGSGSNYQYFDVVVTIPYGKHVWDFRQTAHQNTSDTDRFKKGDYSYTPEGLVAMMNANGTDWNRVYKVRHRVDGHWTLLISPILAARGSVYGNNAFYMDNTNGLVFLTGSDSFGAEETYNEHGSTYEKDHGLAGIDDDEEFGYDYTTVKGADKVWIMGDDASILFPGVKAGQYIKIYTYRHSDDRGETFKAKNLVDLDNVTYDYNTPFLMRGFANGSVYPAMVGDNMRGCAIFRVPSDYTATNDPESIPRLTLCDIGWTQIYRIEIMDEYEPDLLLGVETANGYVPVEYDAVTSSILVRGGTAEERNFLAIAAYTGCQNANTCEYKVYPDAGVNVGVTRSTWKSGGGVWYNNMTLKFNSGNGLVRIVQREKAATDMTSRNTVTDAEAGAAGYVIDKNEYYIAVGELNALTYPYTWDFSTYNLYQNDSQTKANLGATSEGEYGDWAAIENNANGFGQTDKEVADFGTGTFAKVGTTKDNVAQEAEVTRPLFAQGAQLSSGKVSNSALAQNLIIETEGLGVRRPYGDVKQFPYLYSEKIDGVTTYHVGLRDYGSYDLEDGGISFDGSVLSGIGEMTIPDVDNGMYVFVQSDAAPTSVTIKGQTVDAIEVFDKYASATDIPTGVYAYKNTGDKGDVVLNFDESTGIVKIGVTNIHKEVNDLGYATESRNHAIDHTYTGQFTTSDVNAFGVTIYGDDNSPYNYQGYDEVHKTDEVTVIPANTGCVLYGAQTNGRRYEFPLFYPACNVVPTANDVALLKTNWMAPNVVATEHDSETETASAQNGLEGWVAEDIPCTKFVMTRTYYVYKKSNATDPGEVESGPTQAEVESFYRLRIDPTDNTKNVLGANKAYLLVPSESLETALWNGGTNGYVNMFYIDLADVESLSDDDPTSIETVENVVSENNVYYTLTGIRLNGKPTVKGFYLCNGKKVYVK